MRAFPRPKHPDAAGWYQVRWAELLVGPVSVTVVPNPDSLIALQVQNVQLTGDGYGVAARIIGGSRGTVWEMEWSAGLANGGTVVEEIRLAVGY